MVRLHCTSLSNPSCISSRTQHPRTTYNGVPYFRIQPPTVALAPLAREPPRLSQRPGPSPVPILIPALKVTAPTPSHTPHSSIAQDATIHRAKSVKSVRIQEPSVPILPADIDKVSKSVRIALASRPFPEPVEVPYGSYGKREKKPIVTTLHRFKTSRTPSFPSSSVSPISIRPTAPAPSARLSVQRRNATGRTPR
ncbi:hypothetical protein CALVIDRAFT_370726 [Calocera viscosa TUFC12733]|uniref:Uncharacterized protein n=1 Tax=Calocera viscosa (strain TUFC12733) TaxID=1330018 RepID=A0A167GV95_CALVF|nr:hypothetical protein CALVIDRAFT_370726 [Calocera viscosa TUFC12733]